MTKPREKSREELTAEIEEARKKMRQCENREKVLRQKLSCEERKERTHRLCKRGGHMESLVPERIWSAKSVAELSRRNGLTPSIAATPVARERIGGELRIG